MSGRKSRDKGARTERGVVKLLQAGGWAAERVPLSGSCGGRFAGDISLPFLGKDLCVEVKCRANGFIELYGWLNGKDMLIVKRDHSPPLVVMPLNLWSQIAMKAELAK